MKHGAGIYKTAKKLGCEADEIIDFSSNINSYNPDINITLTDTMVVKYGDSSYSELRKAITKKYQIKKKQMALYNGATSAIFELLKNLKEKRVYLYAPLYGEYEKAARQENKKIIKINRFTDLYKKPKKNSLVVFVNPSTPDGKYYNLEKLFTIWKKQNCTIILDESFLEFEGLISLRNQINYNKKLYIIQSFSKFNACAGVRIGAIFSGFSNIERLKTPLWNLSSFDAQFLTQRLQDKTFENKSKELHQRHKQELFKILEESKLFTEICKSDSNFFLTKSERADEIFEHLLKHKILVRTCGSFDFLDNTYLRFAVKETNMHNRLTRALSKFTPLYFQANVVEY
ncbi:MAG: aminotransferase class I/II-fold pyridoxal phosphate-dependent enzyme [Campylobacterales bacterium]|nr:aminotransferase class I/II-fold pyridoxal phosphate-dependent enzyme [Campylobacterales bacterium]